MAGHVRGGGAVIREAWVRLALAVALVAQLWPWQQITRDTDTLAWGAVVVLAVGAAGFAGRWLRAPGPLVGFTQAAVAALTVTIGIALRYGWVTARSPLRLAEAGWDAVQGSSAPMAASAGAMFLLTTLVAVVALIADWLVVAAERPATVFLPLLTLYAVPAIPLGTPMLFAEFVLVAVGTMVVLVAATPRPGRVLGAAAWASAAAVTVGALGVTWLVAEQLPALEPPDPRAPLQMTDPSLDLKRNLVQGSDDVIIRYTSDVPGGVYLKLATLPRFAQDGFGLQDVRVASGRLPPPPGLASGGTPRTTRVEIGEFGSEWLPAPYAPTSFEAAGEWGFALDTLDIMSLAEADRTAATAGLDYTVSSRDVRPSPEDVAAATTSADGGRARQLELLPQVPQRVRDLAREVTADAPTAGAKARALEAFLTSDRFTYSLAPSDATGDGLATIDDFLFRSRAGYCEQFAGAMAILAREVGIPSRMAVGFVPGTQVGEGAYELTARDLHTWPELWLDGWGWVAFEPTPARGEPGTNPQGTATPTATPTATASATASASATPTTTPTAGPQAGPTTGGTAAVGGWLLAGLALLVAAAAAVLGPRLARLRRRRRRLTPTGDARADTLAAWDEVRETVTDAGLTFPPGSPRYAAEGLVDVFAADADALAGLRRLARAGEQALFDRPDALSGPVAWGDEVGAIVAALAARAQRGRRARRAR